MTELLGRRRTDSIPGLSLAEAFVWSDSWADCSHEAHEFFYREAGIVFVLLNSIYDPNGSFAFLFINFFFSFAVFSDCGILIAVFMRALEHYFLNLYFIYNY